MAIPLPLGSLPGADHLLLRPQGHPLATDHLSSESLAGTPDLLHPTELLDVAMQQGVLAQLVRMRPLTSIAGRNPLLESVRHVWIVYPL